MRRTMFLGLLPFLWAPGALSCQCLGLLIEEQVYRAAHIFRAQVTSAELIERGLEGSGRVKANFDVIALLKGNPTELDGVTAVIGGGTCEVPIVVGLEYVFFVTADGEATTCGGTMPRRRISFGDTGEWFEFVRRYGLGTDY